MLDLAHKKLEVWKSAMDLVVEAYKRTEDYPKSEVYGITSQIRRSAVSVPANIAEGASRSSSADRRRFYEISRSSLVELDTLFETSKRLEYVSQESLDKLSGLANGCFAMLTGMLQRSRK